MLVVYFSKFLNRDVLDLVRGKFSLQGIICRRKKNWSLAKRFFFTQCISHWRSIKIIILIWILIYLESSSTFWLRIQFMSSWLCLAPQLSSYITMTKRPMHTVASVLSKDQLSVGLHKQLFTLSGSNWSQQSLAGLPIPKLLWNTQTKNSKTGRKLTIQKEKIASRDTQGVQNTFCLT